MPSEIEKLKAERDELRALVRKQFDGLAELQRAIARQEAELARIRRLMRDRDRLAAELAANRHPLEWDRN